MSAISANREVFVKTELEIINAFFGLLLNIIHMFKQEGAGPSSGCRNTK